MPSIFWAKTEIRSSQARFSEDSLLSNFSIFSILSNINIFSSHASFFLSANFFYCCLFYWAAFESWSIRSNFNGILLDMPSRDTVLLCINTCFRSKTWDDFPLNIEGLLARLLVKFLFLSPLFSTSESIWLYYEYLWLLLSYFPKVASDLSGD